MATRALNFPITAENRTARVFAKIKGDIGGISQKLVAMKALVIGAVGVAGFGLMAKDVLNLSDKIHKLNLRIGATPEALSQLKHAAALSGVSFEALTMSLQRGTRRIAEAANGTGAAKKALEELGLDAQLLAAMKPEEQLNMMADAFKNVAKDSDKVRLAMAIFGREGVSLLQMMQDGSAGIKQMREEADELGLTLSQDDVNAAAAFNDSLERLKKIFYGIVQDITIGLAPAMENAVSWMVEWYKTNKDIIGLKAAEIFENMRAALEKMWPAIQKVAQWFGNMVDAISKAISWWRQWDAQVEQNLYGGGGGGNAPAPSGAAAFAPGSAAAIALAGGGDRSLSADEQWADAAMSGPTVTNNFNTQISRSDAVAIAAESARQVARR